MFLHPSWPWTYGNQSTILTAGTDGTCNVTGLDGRILHSFNANQSHVNAICATPELFNQCAEDGFYSKTYPSKNRFCITSDHNFNILSGLLMCGGDKISAYVPDMGIKEVLREHEDSPIWKLR